MLIKFLEYCWSFLDFTTVLIGITVWLFLHRVLSTKRYTPPLPPSPTVALPVIGHFHLIGPDMREGFRKYRQKCGQVFSLQFGTRLAIVISGYETLKEAFVKQGDAFAARPFLQLTDRVVRRSGVALTSGAVWKEHRRFCLSKLKDFGMGKSMLETHIHEEANTLVTELRAQCGKPFNPKNVISTHVVNIISLLVFKGHFAHGDERLLKMIAMIDENVHSNALAANFLPWLDKIPGDPMKTKNLLRNSDYIFGYIEEIIADHEKEYDENDINDLTSAYIQELRRLKKTNEPTTMNYQQLAGTIGDLFVAGTETTTTTISWAIPCLVTYPNIQDKLYREITTAIGTERFPTSQDKTRLAYLEAFFLEVLRFCNLTITSGAHATTHDLHFKGFTIPSDAIILPDLDSVFTDKEIWGDPEVFRPERFINNDGSLKKKDEAIMFFLGKRNCIGESLARMELLIFLGALVQNFKFDSCPGETLTVEKVDGQFGFVHGPKPYQVLITAR